MKKMQNTANRNQTSKLQSAPKKESNDNRPRIDMALRHANRKLNTDKLIDLLRDSAPNFFAVSEVVGKWVWIQFTDKQPPAVTCVLAELGFHWNNTRQPWQHPCGTITDDRATYDPRKRYGSYFPAKVA